MPKMAFFQRCQPKFSFTVLGQKEHRNNVLDKKETLSYYKKNNFSKVQKSIFSKGLTHDFFDKIPNFLLPFQGKKSLKIMFQIKRKVFETIKIRIFQKSTNRIFPKGLAHDFRQRNPNFLSLSFRAKSAQKWYLTIFQIKNKLFQSKKITTFQKSKYWNFPKGLTYDFC